MKNTSLLKPLKTDKALNRKSAFYSLGYPSDALAARLYLIDHATTSLDVQYYIYKDDTIGNLISMHLVKAAERGVRVRILLDDINTAGKDEKLLHLAVKHIAADCLCRFFRCRFYCSLSRGCSACWRFLTGSRRKHHRQ